jgi:putative chitinase
MSKIQEFITAWDTEVNKQIATAQSEIDAYLAARQTAIALTDPFILKMPTLEVLNIDPIGITIPGFNVTTLGQLFDWSYPAEGMKAYDKYGNYRSKPDVVEDYVNRKYDRNDNPISPTSLYTEGYTYATMSYLAEQYDLGLRTRLDLRNILNTKDSGFVSLESYKKLKNLGGKVWFDNWMRSLYSVISGTKISVSKLKASEYSNIFMSIEDVMRDNYLKGYYDEGTRFKIDGINASAENSKYFQAVLEAGDAFFPTQNSGTQSGTQSQGSGDYKLEVINPLSDNEKKINGKIVFVEDGQYLISNSTLNGLPNPWTNPVTNTIVSNNTGTITYNANKSTAGKSALSNDIIINLQNIVQSTYGLTIYLRSTPQDTPTEIPPPDADVPLGSTASTENIASATASQESLPLQELVFNVELQDIFSNSSFGNLFIIGKEDTIVFDDDQVDYSEYVEEEFEGEEEQLIKLDDINVELLNDIKGFDPENPDPAISTDSGSKYPIPKNKQANINAIIKSMNKNKITNKFTQAAILAIVSKESAFVPKNEASYAKTSASRIKGIFKAMRKYSDEEVDRIKKIPKQFFDIIYGNKNGNGSDEGFKYRGRGFNQLTFKANYLEAQNQTGHRLVSDPDLLNTIDVAADCIVVYYLKRFPLPNNLRGYYNNPTGDINKFTKLEDAVGAIYHATAGYGNSYNTLVADSTGGRKKAFGVAPNLYKNIA